MTFPRETPQSEFRERERERERECGTKRRRSEKVHDMMDAARKKGQRRAVYLANERDDPQQSIQLHGYRCRMYRDDGLYQTTEDQQGLPSSGQILEALLTDPASRLSLDKEKSYKVSKPQKDTAIETTKKREQERQKLEKLAVTSRSSRYRHHSCSRSYSRSPPR